MHNAKDTKEEFVVKKDDAGVRLDKFLAQKFIDFSRVYFQKLIREGKVLINGKNNTANYKLKEGDTVIVDFIEIEKIDLAPDKKILGKIRIIYEDDDLIVIDKPGELVVHPSATNKSGTLVNGLLARWPDLINIGEDKTRPGIVHRLDKETSGLMLVVKNNNAFNYFKRLFQERGVEKHYLALVWGIIDKEEGIINLPIVRSEKIPLKQTTVKDISDKTNAREAITEYRVLERYKEWTLVEARPKTGRMHQIRVHFRAIGHPIANDKKYAFRNQKIIKGLDRHFLHAAYLKFVSPKGKLLEFSSSLPSDLEKVIKGLLGNIG